MHSQKTKGRNMEKRGAHRTEVGRTRRMVGMEETKRVAKVVSVSGGAVPSSFNKGSGGCSKTGTRF